MSSKKSFIDIRISGVLEIVAKDRDDAIRQVRDRIMQEILTEHPSFESTGLPDLWVEWLDSEVEKLVGIEIKQTDEPVYEEINARWTNKQKDSKKDKLDKGGRWGKYE